MSEIVFISLSEILKWSFFFFFFFFQGMKPMTIHVVDLLEDLNPSINEESKVSSVNQRMRLLGTLLQQPQVWQSTFSLSLFFLNCYFSFFFTLFPFTLFNSLQYYAHVHQFYRECISCIHLFCRECMSHGNVD